MHEIELWKQISLIVLMIISLLVSCVMLAYATLSPAKEFKEEIEFKPLDKVGVRDVRNNGID